MTDPVNHPASVRRRFWQYVWRRQDHQCWPWLASKMKRGGYGQLRDGRKTLKAHRLAWELNLGPIPDGMLIRHLCNNPICCNPTHLLPGTDKQNHEDMQRSGRMFVPQSPVGTDHHSARLDEGKVLSILESELSGAELARRLGVSRSMISRIRTGKAWKRSNQI